MVRFSRILIDSKIQFQSVRDYAESCFLILVIAPEIFSQPEQSFSAL